MKKQEIVVITGASSGVGRAAAHAFAKEGAKLALIARNEEALNAAKTEVEMIGASASIYVCDVSDYNSLEKTVSKIENEIGFIDVWVNNAMVSAMSSFIDLSPEEFKRITEVTYLGYVWGTQIALKKMCPRNHGTIVQVGSALAYRSIPLQSAYCGAKHAIAGFTESIRCELLHAKSNVHITIVQLPGVNTPQFNWVRNKFLKCSRPVGIFYQPEVAAEAIVWAAHHKRKEMLVGLPTLESIFGNRIFPSLLDHYLARKVYRGHFTHKLEIVGRPDNLFYPVPLDYGTHGPYDRLAKKRSWELEFSKKKVGIGITLLTALFSALFLKKVGGPKHDS